MAIAIAARYTDLFNVVRRRKAMSLPASIQWDLLPPLDLRTPEASSIGVLEPAYDVGGDCFDHAVNGSTVDVAIMDAMGHGLESSLVSSLAIESYRHDRREGQSLAVIHRRLDQVLGEHFARRTVRHRPTGQARRAVRSAGLDQRRPPPTPPRPGGPGGGRARLPTLAALGARGRAAGGGRGRLQPGDSVVFYTDGVIEGRGPSGEAFGIERFVDLIERVLRRPSTQST